MSASFSFYRRVVMPSLFVLFAGECHAPEFTTRSVSVVLGETFCFFFMRFVLFCARTHVSCPGWVKEERWCPCRGPIEMGRPTTDGPCRLERHLRSLEVHCGRASFLRGTPGMRYAENRVIGNRGRRWTRGADRDERRRSHKKDQVAAKHACLALWRSLWTHFFARLLEETEATRKEENGHPSFFVCFSPVPLGR